MDPQRPNTSDETSPSNGESPGADPWFEDFYQDLRGLADRALRKERIGHTLSATALVNEAFVKLAPGGGAFNDTTHFRSVASRAMRQVLCDHARARGTAKRGGGAVRVTLVEGALIDPAAGSDVEYLDLEVALQELATRDPRKAEGVELRLFGGLSHEEVGDALGIGRTTAESDWYLARAWLARRLGLGEATRD